MRMKLLKHPAALIFASFLLQGSVFYADASSWPAPLDWSEVNELLPRYSTFTVEDVETGREFKVQRRAGSRHADVQPLTAKDTAVMKEIYDGKWSWRRRAIIVKSGKLRIAASMHGMPHGAGALANNFPGHFCIHFNGSTTHRRDEMDLSHKLMILKSAGELEAYTGNAGPEEAASAFIAGLKQQDEDIAGMLSLQKLPWKKILPVIENVQLESASGGYSMEEKQTQLLEVSVEVDWYIKNEGKRHYKGKIEMIKMSAFDGWKVNAQKFLEENRLFER
ncbi:hypothetical protein ABXS71_13635 [Bacillus infantis]|uniref:hypothetical protein n=1 Tax=Bacillus infantis TaxID=324767 RepID=UPI0034502420